MANSCQLHFFVNWPALEEDENRFKVLVPHSGPTKLIEMRGFLFLRQAFCCFSVGHGNIYDLGTTYGFPEMESCWLWHNTYNVLICFGVMGSNSKLWFCHQIEGPNFRNLNVRKQMRILRPPDPPGCWPWQVDVRVARGHVTWPYFRPTRDWRFYHWDHHGPPVMSQIQHWNFTLQKGVSHQGFEHHVHAGHVCLMTRLMNEGNVGGESYVCMFCHDWKTGSAALWMPTNGPCHVL